MDKILLILLFYVKLLFIFTAKLKGRKTTMKFQDVFFLYCLDIKEVIAALVGTPVESVDSNNATLTLESVSSYNILKR